MKLCVTGAYLLLEFSNSMIGLSRLQGLLNSFLAQDQFAKVAGHISRPAAVFGASSNTIQIVLSDIEEYRGDCNDLADALAAKLNNSKYQQHCLPILIIPPVECWDLLTSQVLMT